jgi:hypothetical protein
MGLKYQANVAGRLCFASVLTSLKLLGWNEA